MGWRGAIRSIAAASRAAEREAQRRHKQDQKEQMIAESASAVSDWEDYIHDLVSIHADMADRIDWQEILSRPRPGEPEKHAKNYELAQAALAKFRPSFFHIFRGGTERLRHRLQSDLEGALKHDELEHQARLENYKAELAEWEEDTSLAQQLLRGEAAAVQKVVEELDSLTSNGLIGTAVEFSIGANFLHACPKVHDDSIIPKSRLKQLASGRLSETKMPIGQFNELYQDYVASVALKTAGDLFHVLPLEEIYITCESYMLNMTTGHQEWSPVISVYFVRDTFLRLNLKNVDPSEALRNFKHTMKFSRTKGFSAIDPLVPVGSPD